LNLISATSSVGDPETVLDISAFISLPRLRIPTRNLFPCLSD
jgi:hypothetical protein